MLIPLPIPRGTPKIWTSITTNNLQELYHKMSQKGYTIIKSRITNDQTKPLQNERELQEGLRKLYGNSMRAYTIPTKQTKQR